MNPTDVQGISGSTAEFQCHFSGTAGVSVHATWVVNGSVLNRATSRECDPTSTTNSKNGVIVSTLHILTVTECNETEVYCIAVWFNGSTGIQMIERSNSAFLYVQGKKYCVLIAVTCVSMCNVFCSKQMLLSVCQ